VVALVFLVEVEGPVTVEVAVGEQGAESQDGDADAMANLGVLLVKQGRPCEAAEFMHRAVEAGHEGTRHNLDGLLATLELIESETPADEQ
jgi:hypothetical protein